MYECSAYMCQCAVYMLGACEGHQRAPEPLELCVDGCVLPRDSGTEPGSSVRAALTLSSLLGCLSGSWVVLSIHSFICLPIHLSYTHPSGNGHHSSTGYWNYCVLSAHALQPGLLNQEAQV